MQKFNLFLQNEASTIALGACLANAFKEISKLKKDALCVYLDGDLGAGKTTFSRGLIQKLGHTGIVKSPTYTLVESYDCNGVKIFHFDLYRLCDPEELEYIGGRDYFAQQAIILVEWAQKAEGFIASYDILLNIKHEKDARSVEIVIKDESFATIVSENLKQFRS